MSGYATRLANLVNIGFYYKAFPETHPEQGRTSSSTNIDGDGAPAIEPNPKNAKEAPQDAGMDPQNLDTPTNQAATP